MGWAILAHDAPGAAAERAARRVAHVALLTEWASAGRLALAVPLFDAAGAASGSLILLSGDAAEERDVYLAREPFAQPGVWARHAAHPFRLATLPYRRLPQPGEVVATARTHTVVIAMDGSDDNALARRLAVREQHFARVRSMAESGELAAGGALLDASGERMLGSIAVIRAADDVASRAWLADDPYVTGDVWRDITLYGTRFLPLPYRALPGGA